MDQDQKEEDRGDAAEQQAHKIRISVLVLVANTVDRDKRRHAKKDKVYKGFKFAGKLKHGASLAYMPAKATPDYAGLSDFCIRRAD